MPRRGAPSRDREERHPRQHVDWGKATETHRERVAALWGAGGRDGFEVQRFLRTDRVLSRSAAGRADRSLWDAGCPRR